MNSHRAYDDSVAQYVAGMLPARELEAFEQHLITCAACRDAVRLGAATRVALRSNVRTTSARPSNWARRALLPGLAAAAAAVVIMFVASRDSSLDRLGEITPAPFVAGALRPSGDSLTALVDSGMLAYVASDFRKAADLLGRASVRDSSAAVAFFLGVSLLMRGDDAAALKALERVTPGSPYTDDGSYYAAKALVRLKQPDSAMVVLEQSAAVGPMAETLRAFADSLRRR